MADSTSHSVIAAILAATPSRLVTPNFSCKLLMVRVTSDTANFQPPGHQFHHGSSTRADTNVVVAQT